MVPDALEDGAENGGKTDQSRDADLGSKTDSGRNCILP